MGEIMPIAMPGTHRSFLKFFKSKGLPTNLKILDLGAGHGAFTKALYEMGYDVYACDLFPEIFEFDRIKCQQVDITAPFPYEDNMFDIVIAIEVSEHITDHQNFFGETSRILKPDGNFYLSTPNILSLKSRIRFLKTGFYYSFNPLEMDNYDGLQHIASLTIDQYNFIAIKNNFKEADIEVDRFQSTSRWLYIFLYPLLFLFSSNNKLNTIHNQKKLLLGRLLFLNFKNNKPSNNTLN